jgi:hypothetical protein
MSLCQPFVQVSTVRVASDTLQVFTVTDEGISRNSVFQDSEVFASFGLATNLEG